MIIIKESHLDHNLSVGQLDFIKKKFADRKEFFKETFELPAELGTVEVGLIGPVTGCPSVAEDDVRYAVRGSRKWASRLIKDKTISTGCGDVEIQRPALPQSRLVTVIAGPHTSCLAGGACTGAVCAEYDSHLDHVCVLYTAYGGPQAPREPGDINISTWDELMESRAFWAHHALVS